MMVELVLGKNDVVYLPYYEIDFHKLEIELEEILGDERE